MVITALFEAAVGVFGTEEKANAWFNEECPALAGNKPIDFLNHLHGIEQVFQVLERMQQLSTMLKNI